MGLRWGSRLVGRPQRPCTGPTGATTATRWTSWGTCTGAIMRLCSSSRWRLTTRRTRARVSVGSRSRRWMQRARMTLLIPRATGSQSCRPQRACETLCMPTNRRGHLSPRSWPTPTAVHQTLRITDTTTGDHLTLATPLSPMALQESRRKRDSIEDRLTLPSTRKMLPPSSSWRRSQRIPVRNTTTTTTSITRKPDGRVALKKLLRPLHLLPLLRRRPRRRLRLGHRRRFPRRKRRRS
mmetsp:Transcript_82791/g.183969  ORF Transcript_82791/g.183969 Transcript_82791/m.183969 type:complete len:238 (-) Transcript_82791:420-1133(-)